MKLRYIIIILLFLSGCSSVEPRLDGLWKSNKNLTKVLNKNYRVDEDSSLYHFMKNRDFYLVLVDSANKISEKQVTNIIKNNFSSDKKIIIKKHRILKIKYDKNRATLKLLSEDYNMIELKLTIDNDCYTYHVDPSINFGKEFHEVFCKVNE